VILIGELSLWVALLMAIWGATVSFAGSSLGRRDLIASGERAIYATLAMLVLASLGLWTAIFTHDFSFKYVASFTSANLPAAYLLASFWAGAPGSLLFWSLILSIYSTIAVWTNRTRNRVLMPYVSGTLAVVLVFFIARMCLGANPYERLDWIPPEGQGLNPALQNPGMVIHPPTLYLGYFATTIPFAFAIAALMTRRIDADWLSAVRKWAMLAWFFNTAGILLGMWWAYVEPGRGGHWAWDPVQNASLLPWLVNTAFLYSVTVQEKSGMLRKWNVTLVVITFLLAILATFITRSGITSSAHPGSPIGNWFPALFVIAIASTVYAVNTRLKDLEVTGEVESPTSVQGSSADLFARNRRRYGGYILKAGVVVLLFAFAGLTFRKKTDLTFKPGDSRDVTDPYGHKWTFVSQGISRYDVLNRQVAALVLDLSRDGQAAGVMSSEKRQYVDSRGEPTFDPSTEAGIQTSPGEDIYVVLAAVRPDDSAEVRVTFNPLAVWVWLGGALITLGGMIVMWPRARH
jgi:cytochrome c biogenesis factor